MRVWGVGHALKYAVNCSLMFTELPLLERPAAARAAGFEAVEFWWPFSQAVPSDHDADAFVRAVRDAGVRLIGLNFFAGDLAAGDRGAVSWPACSERFRDNVPVVAGIAEQLGCRAFNALYGNRVDGVDPRSQDDLAVENLAFAAAAVAPLRATVLLEPVSGAPRYPIRTAADAFAVLDRVQTETGVSNIALLADLYHLAVNGDDVDKVIDVDADRIAHVQIADAPGRHEPGSGTLPLERYVAALESRGYEGWVALEYKPATTTGEGLAWLPAELRAPERA